MKRSKNFDRPFLTCNSLNIILTLDDSTIIQTDATVIAGILILLTLSSFGDIKEIPSILDSIGGFEGATALVVVPFAVSAITISVRHSYVKGIEYRSARRDLLMKKIENITKSNSSSHEMKFRNELNKYRKKLNVIQRRIEKHNEITVQSWIMTLELLSLSFMMIGFVYLIIVMLWLVKP